MKCLSLALLAIIVSISGFMQAAFAQRVSLASLLPEAGPDFRICEQLQHGDDFYFTTFTAGKMVSLYKIGARDAAVTLVYQWATQSGNYTPMRPVSYKGRIWFPQSDSAGRELWSSDGTPQGTFRFAELCPGPRHGVQTNLFAFPEYNDELYVNGLDSNDIGTLWKTDGTIAGTRQVYKFPAQNKRIFGVHGLTPLLQNKVCFFGTDTSATGLYLSDGTQAGTAKTVSGFSGIDVVSYNGQLYLSPYRTPEIFASDGLTSRTISTTLTLTTDHFIFNDQLFFVYGYKLYRISKTSDSIATIADGLKNTQWLHLFTDPMSPFTARNSFCDYKGKLFFAADSSIWCTDGTKAGTSRVKSFNTYDHSRYGPIYPISHALTRFDDKLYFKMVGKTRIELYESDGTDAGTRLVPMPTANYQQPDPDLRRRNSALVDPMLPFRRHLYFTAVYDSSIGKALYRLESALAVREKNPPFEIRLVPNPATGKVTILAPAAGVLHHVSVTDINGRTLYQQALSGKRNPNLDLSALPQGIYTVTVSSELGSASTQVTLMY